MVNPVTETFTCELCGRAFDKEWSDDEAQAEAAEAFGDVDEWAVVCDDCYHRIQKRAHEILGDLP